MIICDCFESCVGCNWRFVDKISHIADKEFQTCHHLMEVELVRRGRWIDNGDYVTTAYGSLDVNVCSNCNAEVTIDHYDSYCPNCGAKMMDGDENG